MLLVCDVDGSIADINRRLAIAGEKPAERDRTRMQEWLDNLQNPTDLLADAPIEPVCNLVRILAVRPDIQLVYVTGRNELLRDVTIQWLQKNRMPAAPLYMRGRTDWSPASVYKEKVMEKLEKLYALPCLVIDDDPDSSCSEMYQRRGYTHLKVEGSK